MEGICCAGEQCYHQEKKKSPNLCSVLCMYCGKGSNAQCFVKRTTEDSMICSTVGLDDWEEEWAVCFLCHWKQLQTEGHAQNCACNQVGDILCTSQRIDIVPRHTCLKCKMVIHYACCKEYRASGNSDTCWKREPICKKCAHVEEKENQVIGRKIPHQRQWFQLPFLPSFPH